MAISRKLTRAFPVGRSQASIRKSPNTKSTTQESAALAEKVELTESNFDRLGPLKRLAKNAARAALSALGGAIGWVVSVLPNPMSKALDGVHRAIRGRFHHKDAVADFRSSENRVLHPRQAIARDCSPETFRISCWNLHHGTSQDSDGARYQLDKQIEVLQEKGADVDLLQEVLPWHAQKLVDETGKRGYYTQTTERQGNLILVRPDLEVTSQARVSLNYDSGDERGASIVRKSGRTEPRANQILTIQGADTNGREIQLFNTHLSTGPQEQRHAENKKFLGSVESSSLPVAGGGDFNTTDGQGVVSQLRGRGFEVEGAAIDWFAGKGVALKGLKAGDLFDDKGVRLSDHPFLIADFETGR